MSTLSSHLLYLFIFNYRHCLCCLYLSETPSLHYSVQPALTNPPTHPGAFLFLLILAGYIGLLPHSTSPSIPEKIQPNDKLLHLVTFFLLSLTFYWIADTSRRRTLQLSLLVCTLILGIGSEILQGFLPNDRAFDPFDLLANVVGSLGAIGLCNLYHRRMLERRRKARFGALMDGTGGDDIELGAGGHEGGAGLGPQETGVMTLEQEVDRWDENAIDPEDSLEEPVATSTASKTTGPDRVPAAVHGDGIEDVGGKKRSD